ncbi:zinc-ribbon domain-containing protein [Pediococcus acidilactici]|nr:zinc-ribbon domain-containing protein [Pediococcus acidilactici]KAF0338090.1 zinc-ribbon domain-containing protein [Pediococcus acidilactici]KAF0350011.1 zinc-ribbon domain-containing protein [Pediococcus acidilactici]KAF0377915.1 zinc-ribbon domain-containing protein [Pediococcus acidilactici]KAF0386136.1 zinc-ribbon domain-containing protein [Pediococcus acidilactici]
MKEMKFCTKCGTAIEPGDQFCTSCGTPVAQMQAPEAPANSAAAEKVTEKPATTQETVTTTTSAIPAATDLKAEKTATTTAAPESDAVDEIKAPRSTTQAQEAPTTAAATAKETANDANSTATSATIDKEKVSATVDQTKEYAKSYWNWLTTSVKHPFSYPETTNPLYGITTFVIFAIVSALILIVSGRQTFNALDSKVKVSVIMENPFTFGVFLKFLAIFAVLFALMVLVGILVTQFLGAKGQTVTWFTYTNKLAHFINYALVLGLLALGMLFVAGPELVDEVTTDMPDILFRALLGMALAGLNLGFIATFFEEKLKFEFDRIYVAILAEAVLFIALYLGVEHLLIPAITQVGTSFN